MSTVNIRGVNYEAQEFSNIHLGHIQSFLVNVATLDLNIKAQNDVGYILKEIIFPDIDEAIVKKIDNNFAYIVLLDTEEISDICVELTKIFAQRRLEVAKTKGDQAAIAKYENTLKTDFEQKEVDLGTIEELQDQLNRLKAKAQK